MIGRELLASWGSLAPALGNHLWQSTVVVAAAGVLTLGLRKNHARARYWLWLSASMKFLVPFSWLEAAGGQLSWARVRSASGGLSLVIEQVNRPFAASAWPRVSPGGLVHGPFPHQNLGLMVAAIWLCGFAFVLTMWCLRWRRLAAVIRESEPALLGRELEALRRLESAMGTGPRVEMRISRTMLEPGIFGVLRPVLIWPLGVSACLDEEHLDAVLAHELCHVQSRDNLAALLHMLVEAAFWFHPLVWWLGARLIDERERACDEQVLELGSKRSVYAESILKVCQFCVGSPLACVSGVTGSDLKKRMVRIMSEGMVHKLDFFRKILLTAAALLTIAAPVMIGLMSATPGRAQEQAENSSARFESVSIKPSVMNTPVYAGSNVHMVRMMVGPAGFSARNVTLRSLIQEAYGVQANQVFGGPEWLDTEAFDIDAKTGQPEGTPADLEKGAAVNHQMLQNFLADRAKLALHKASKVLPSYELATVQSGSKLQPSVPAADVVESNNGRVMGARQMMMNMDQSGVRAIAAHEVSTDEIAQQLSRQLGVHVANATGLKGSYDFNLHWMDGKTATDGQNEAPSSDVKGPSLFTALQEQLGLKLVPKDRPTDVLIVDSVERPAEQ